MLLTVVPKVGPLRVADTCVIISIEDVEACVVRHSNSFFRGALWFFSIIRGFESHASLNSVDHGDWYGFDSGLTLLSALLVESSTSFVANIGPYSIFYICHLPALCPEVSPLVCATPLDSHNETFIIGKNLQDSWLGNLWFRQQDGISPGNLSHPLNNFITDSRQISANWVFLVHAGAPEALPLWNTLVCIFV